MGLGKHKKPPIEAWHVAEIVKLGRTDRFTPLQLLQAKALVGVGWHLFNRPQDFNHFQVCDFVKLQSGMRVFIRRAKNDTKGMTRSPLLDEAGDAEACPVKNLLAYFKATKLSVQPGCTKVEGDPECCKVCPPAFPSIHKHAGLRSHAMPKGKVTEIVKKLFLSLADLDLMTAEEASTFSEKLARTGGVSEASANFVRDGSFRAMEAG